MKIIINTPGGSVNFDVPVMKINSYSLSQIFEKDLYFLLPFYIFNLEKNFSQYEQNPFELEKLKTEYTNYFMARIEQAVKNGKITTYYKRTILDMSKKVLENIAAKYENIQKGVNEIMGGRVLEHEGKIIFNEGIAVGEERGRHEEKVETAKRLREAGMDDTQIHQFTNLTLEEIRII